MRNRQRGMSFIGLMSLLALVGVDLYAGIRLTPAYLEYLKVAKTLDALKGETEGAVTKATLQSAIDKHFEIEDVTSLEAKDMEIAHDDAGWTVHAVYDRLVPFLGNVSFAVHFDKKVEIPAN